MVSMAVWLCTKLSIFTKSLRLITVILKVSYFIHNITKKVEHGIFQTSGTMLLAYTYAKDVCRQTLYSKVGFNSKLLKTNWIFIHLSVDALDIILAVYPMG